jgi:penicillin-binding protein 1A
MRAGPGDTAAFLEAFKPGTAPPDTYTVIGGAASGGAVSPEADRAVGAGTGGLY